MKQRPIGPLVDALVASGSKITYLENKGCLPLKIESAEGGLKGGLINLSASVSSQYVSSILISAPYAATPVTLDLTGDSVVSQPYIDMTVAMMKSFGIDVQRIPGKNAYIIPQGVYKNPLEYVIEADASSATYPLALAAILGTKVTVTNMGNDSLQGDSQFAVKVLRKMGCIVEQTATATTVQGPATLLPIPTIDMGSMTDAFMTAVVLAAVAQGGDHITRITGIANQRVKECNRIAVMIEQLDRFGVTASELSDGIQIVGIPKAKLMVPSPNGVKCYDDHRIAMSFSILATAFPPLIPGVVITEKKCVEKTWPSWWDTLSSELSVELVGIDMEAHAEALPSRASDLTIVLIGMRGAGKTQLGMISASHLQYRFIDMDHQLELHCKQAIPEYLKSHSWEEFRQLEATLLSATLASNPLKTVISCGGGIVETAESRSLLKAWNGSVVHIKRNFACIKKYLNIDTTRPLYGDDINISWKRRQPLYEECSNAEFVSPLMAEEASSWSTVNAAFCLFLDFILKRGPSPLPKNTPSFFVSLTCKNVNEIGDIIGKITEGADAIELRVDLLESWDADFVGEQVSLLRSYSILPIVFTVRTKSQGGSYPDSDFEGMLQLLNFGIRWGCEYVDVEFSYPFERFEMLKRAKGASLLIASYHDINGTADWTSSGSMFQIYEQIYQHGDIMKLIGKANKIEDNFILSKFVKGIKCKKPIIAVLMGPLGCLSRCLNSFLTPVTHECIPIPAAPGQLSIKEIHQIQTKIGIISKRHYFLAGHPISQSMSPTIHNTAFKQIGLPHHYTLLETSDWQSVKIQMDNPDSYGASVTIPLKVTCLENGVAQILSEAASKIGALNTLVKRGDGQIEGHNTDWIGIKNCILAHFPDREPTIGIIIGAGGTARAAIYSLQQLGVAQIRIWNRTFEKAQALSLEFGCAAVQDSNALFKDVSVRVFVVGTIPADAQTALDFDKILANNLRGIVVDMAYRPRRTLLLQSAERKGIATAEGIQVLVEQAFEQFRLWTGSHPPKLAIQTAVMEAYQ